MRIDVKWWIMFALVVGVGLGLGVLAALCAHNIGLHAGFGTGAAAVISALIAATAVSTVERVRDGRAVRAALSSLVDSWAWPLEMLGALLIATGLILTVAWVGPALLAATAAAVTILLVSYAEQKLLLT